MWVKHGYKIEPEIDIRLLDAEDPQDWALWQTQSRGKK
jgi:hypothetical protein